MPPATTISIGFIIFFQISRKNNDYFSSFVKFKLYSQLLLENTFDKVSAVKIKMAKEIDFSYSKPHHQKTGLRNRYIINFLFLSNSTPMPVTLYSNHKRALLISRKVKHLEAGRTRWSVEVPSNLNLFVTLWHKQRITASLRMVHTSHPASDSPKAAFHGLQDPQRFSPWRRSYHGKLTPK